jgi:hypothetical protein
MMDEERKRENGWGMERDKERRREDIDCMVECIAEEKCEWR